MKLQDFTNRHIAVGAELDRYPNLADIPVEHRDGRSQACHVASSLFFNGGSLQDHGLKLKRGVSRDAFHRNLYALLGSFSPAHELKIATCGWLIAEHTEPMTADGGDNA